MTKEEAKHLSEVLKAYSEGKIIEYRKKNTVICAWEVYKGQSIDENFYEYRIKPEPKLRSYKDAEEFLKAQKEHGPFIKSGLGKTCAYYSIRVVHPGREGVTFSYALSAGDREVSYQQLLDEMYWQDGHPCGITEE